MAAYINVVSVSGSRVSWHSHNPNAAFLVNRGDPGLQDYRAWVESGSYSAILLDGALLQITYDIEGSEIVGHRLAYIPCPYRLDTEMLRRDPVLELVDLHVETDPTGIVLHSAVRFDYDPQSAGPGHPASHLTINSANCRIACSAPMHVGRFADFIFRHFYSDLWSAHFPYFSAGARRDLGARTLAQEDRSSPHIFWN
ncbi:DUF2290 domain-containing protein [Saccharopolyspora shandongensis]|uniref:DUF2290 domain-containing protein n=1 Tax=Saccharopolyspora shandongensis TaxID=418495 RepID=UPI003CCBC99C